MVRRQQFVDAARVEIGTSFHHQGRSPGHGVDCSGLIVVAANACGLSLPNDRNDYARTPRPGAFLKDMRKGLEGLDVVVEQARLGDVLIFWMRDRPGKENLPQHAAIITQTRPEPRIIHAVCERECVVEHRLDAYWSLRVVHALHVPGVSWDDEGLPLGQLPHTVHAKV